MKETFVKHHRSLIQKQCFSYAVVLENETAIGHCLEVVGWISRTWKWQTDRQYLRRKNNGQTLCNLYFLMVVKKIQTFTYFWKLDLWDKWKEKYLVAVQALPVVNI